MLEKEDYKILNVLLIDNNHGGYKDIEISVSTNLDLDDVRFLLQKMKRDEFVELLPNGRWSVLYKGKHYRRYYFYHFFDKYWFPIITSLISGTLSLLLSLLLT